jgi:predicted outer membrane repeat protein
MNMATRMITIMMAILVAILQSVDARDAGRMIDVRDAQAKAELVSECVCGDEAASNYNCPALPAANNWGCTYKSDCSDLQKWLARRFDVSDTITEDMCHIYSPERSTQWPPVFSGEPWSGAAIIQGRATARGAADRIELASRVDVIWLDGKPQAGLLLRHVKMKAHEAPVQTHQAREEDGGAIYVFRGWLIVEHSAFYGNKAERGYGGAIAIGYADLQVHLNHCIFEDNHAEDGGGAVSIIATKAGEITVANCTFQKNVVTKLGAKGGAFAVLGSDGSSGLSISGSLFQHNRAEKGYGGAIYFHCDVHPVLANCKFVDNVADRLRPNGGHAVHTVVSCDQKANGTTVLTGCRGTSNNDTGGCALSYARHQEVPGDGEDGEACISDQELGTGNAESRWAYVSLSANMQDVCEVSPWPVNVAAARCFHRPFVQLV